MVCSSLEIVDQRIFCESIQKAGNGCEIPMVALMRTLLLEGWLEGIRDQGVWDGAPWNLRHSRSSPNFNELGVPIQHGSERR